MSLDYASMPTWTALYEAALFETDTYQACITEAERAILGEELLTAGDDSERKALSEGLIAVRDLRRMVLGGGHDPCPPTHRIAKMQRRIYYRELKGMGEFTDARS